MNDTIIMLKKHLKTFKIAKNHVFLDDIKSADVVISDSGEYFNYSILLFDGTNININIGVSYNMVGDKDDFSNLDIAKDRRFIIISLTDENEIIHSDIYSMPTYYEKIILFDDTLHELIMYYNKGVDITKQIVQNNNRINILDNLK